MLQENQSPLFQNKTFTQKPIGIIVWLWLFFPVGIYFMWKGKIWSSKTRIIITSIISLFIIVALAGKKENPSLKNEEKKMDVSQNNDVNPSEKQEIENWLKRGNWTCTEVLKGAAPFMRGAMFSFNNGRLIVSGGGTTATNDYEITGIVENYPENTKYSAVIMINNNKDMLTWVDEKIMVLSWGGDKAKLQLQR
jgi:hypothetical protein